MARSVSDSCRPSTKSIARSTESRVISAMFVSPTVTARLVGFRRAPPHSGHGRSVMYSSIRSFWYAESVSLYRRSRLVTMPSNASM